MRLRDEMDRTDAIATKSGEDRDFFSTLVNCFHALGYPDVVSIYELKGQASNRRYFRVQFKPDKTKKGSSIVMKLPPDACSSEEAVKDNLPTSKLPFVDVQNYLARLGIPVPKIEVEKTELGFLILEDLGDATLLRKATDGGPETRWKLLIAGIDLLVKIQLHTISDSVKDCIAYKRRFDYELLRWELEHFKQWALVVYGKAKLVREEDTLLSMTFDQIARELAGQPYIFVHRDFQSTNLMVDSQGCLKVIDFQDALLGPPLYDLTAFLRDSYLVLTGHELTDLLDYYYVNTGGVVHNYSKREFIRQFHLQTLQRKLKDAGRFVFIDKVKGNPAFLKFLEPTIGYVRNAFDRLEDEFDDARAIIGRWLWD